MVAIRQDASRGLYQRVEFSRRHVENRELVGHDTQEKQ